MFVGARWALSAFCSLLLAGNSVPQINIYDVATFRCTCAQQCLCSTQAHLTAAVAITNCSAANERLRYHTLALHPDFTNRYMSADPSSCCFAGSACGRKAAITRVRAYIQVTDCTVLEVKTFKVGCWVVNLNGVQGVTAQLQKSGSQTDWDNFVERMLEIKCGSSACRP
jgi:hypothetical protein